MSYGYWGHDSWEGRGWGHPPQARHPKNSHRDSDHLASEPQHFNLHRSHSQGHPANIHIYNKIPIMQETTNVQRTEPRPPMPAPMPPPQQYQPIPVMQPPMFVPQHIPMLAPLDHHALRAQRLGEQMMEMDLHRQRSHSRGRSTEDQSARLRWELEQGRRDAAAAEARRRHDEETAAFRTQFELERRKEEALAAEAKRIREEEANTLKLKLELDAEREAAKRKQAGEDAAADRQRVIDDYERKRIADAQAAKDAEAAYKLKLEQQAREDQEREQRAYEDFLHRQRETEAEEERAYREVLRKQKEKEEAKERKYQAFLREQKEKQEAEDQAKKEEQARIDSIMRARMEKLGFSQHDIELALDPEKAEKEKKKKKKHRYSGSPGDYHDGDIVTVPHSLPDAPPIASVGFSGGGGHVPVYPRINRKFLDIETLEHYHVPWEWDRANSDFIILLRELNKYETDVLFEHTSRRRRGVAAPLPIEKSKDKAPNYAWVRRKSKERSKSRGRDIRVTEIHRR